MAALRMTCVLFFLAAGVLVSVDAGCEWYDNCGACVADAGCGWCSNDPKGVGSGVLSSLADNQALTIGGIDNEGNALNIGDAVTGLPQNDTLLNIRGQYRRVSMTDQAGDSLTVEAAYEFEGTGLISSPYFGYTSHDASRGKQIVGIHKTKFLTEVKAGYTIKPYNRTVYTVQSVQSDVMLTTATAVSESFADVEYQIGNYQVSGTISYPDTSQTSLYGSWAPNPSKFTTELKDGFTISTGSEEHSHTDSPARVGSVVNDQLLVLSSKFIRTFENEPVWVELGARGAGLVSGTQDNSRITGSDPCKTGYPCHPETRFIEELRVNDVIEITNATDTADKYFYTVAAIYDDAHLELSECLLQNGDENSYGDVSCTGMDDSFSQGKLHTTTKFKIKTFHNAPYTYARQAQGGIMSPYYGDDNRAQTEVSTTSSQPLTSSLTHILGKDYAIIVQTEAAGTSSANSAHGATQTNALAPKYERRMVKGVTAANKMIIDSKFSKAFDNSDTDQFADAVTDFHYESCPSLTYENFDHRVENGPGLLSGTGAAYVYDNTQYAEITSAEGEFESNVRVGYNIILRQTGVKRRVTKIVSDTKLYINRPFSENTGFSQYAYQIEIRKGHDKNGMLVNNSWYNRKDSYGSDYHIHWKPRYASGGQNSRQQNKVANEQQMYAHQIKSSTTTSGAEIKMQDPYMLYPPVCYNNGRCVPKTSHSLVGVEGTRGLANVGGNGGYSEGGRIFSSSTLNNVYDLVGLGARQDGSTDDATTPYYSDCKPVCTITASLNGVWETRQVVGSVHAHNATHLYTEMPFTHNNQSYYNNELVPGIVPNDPQITAYNALTDVTFRVRYVTGTGTVHWCPNGRYGGKNCGTELPDVGSTQSYGAAFAASPARFTLTGASKETKTKFNSETSTQWSLIVPCTQYCWDSTLQETVDPDYTLSGSTRSNPLCPTGTTTMSAENRTIMTITSDTKLTVTSAFTQNNNKVPYCIGSIPALGRVTSPQGHTKVYGDTDTRFLEQLRVNYYVTVNGARRKITDIVSNSEMSVDSPFPGGINTKLQMTFEGKLGTGEVSTSNGDTEVLGTLDVTETKFTEELAPGYLLMVGKNYKVITNIESATKLTVDTPFDLMVDSTTSATYGIWRNAYNYESCFTYNIGEDPDNNADVGNAAEGAANGYELSHKYQTKHVYVEDACEIKPGCCGFKLSSTVWPDKWAYYKVRPAHSNMNIRVVATTLEDNIDLVYKKDSVPTTSSYDNTSVRESNPWALTIFAKDITCGDAYVGYDFDDTLGAQIHLADGFTQMQTALAGSASEGAAYPRGPGRPSIHSNAIYGTADNTFTADWEDYTPMSGADNFAPSNCSFFYIGVRGDNRYPQKTGASEYDLTVYTEFDFPNFLCSDAGVDDTSDGTESDPASACIHLGLTVVEDAAFVLNEEDSKSVMRLTPASMMRKGAMYYSTKVHLYHGFETSFTFRISHFTVGCNSVLYPSGFCGGGDGFAFVMHEALNGDIDIGCYGGAMGYGTISREDQGNDWSRPRCLSYDSSTAFDLTSAGHRTTYYTGYGCDSGIDQTSDVSSEGTINWDATTVNNTAQDDGLFTELCGLGALCTVAPDGTHGCGNANGMCGYPSCTQAIGRVVAVEFDTWNNLNLHDPKQGVSRWWINATDFVGYNDNHVAIFSSDSTQGTSTDHASPNHFAATPSIPNLADGQIHEVKIKYWPQFDGQHVRTLKKNRGVPHETAIGLSLDCQDQTIGNGALYRYPAPDHCYPGKFSNTKPGNLAIFIDNMQRPVLQTKISLQKGDQSQHCIDADTDRHILDTQGNAYIGFTAATGGERTGVQLDESGVARTFDYTRPESGSDYGSNSNYQYANEAAKLKVGAGQRHEILSWKFCNKMGCVPI